MAADSPAVLLLGGCGMIGRNLLKYIVDFQLASNVRVVDKLPPSMAFLTPPFRAAFNHPSVEFIQANLAVADHVERAFAPVSGAPPFALVINLAAEGRFGLMEQHYELHIKVLRTLCAKKAASLGTVDKYIEVSTAQVYKGDGARPCKETDPLSPWSIIGKYHLMAEAAVRATAGLNHIILRLPVVYGPGDQRGLLPRVVAAAVYEYTEEKMEFLWGEDLRVHTVHVQDVAGGIWHLLCAGTVGEVYNLVDDGDTTQGKLNVVLESIFRIKTGFYGSIMSTMAQITLDSLVEQANTGHMAPWTEMCQEFKVDSRTPLTPYLDKELLYNNPICIDGKKMKAIGFECSCPQLTKELLEDSMSYWSSQGLFPRRQ